MFILENVPLSAYSTMRLGGPAAYLTDITDRREIAEALYWAEQCKLPAIMIGGGSNIVWGDQGYPGLVMVNKIMRFEAQTPDDENCYLTLGAGENWDEIVGKSTEMGYSGIEELSLIPGTAGATPVQNVGAYGREIKDVLMTIEAYDNEVKQLVTLRGSECDFGYRTSRFKTNDKGRFFISAITLHLVKLNPRPPFYQSVQHYFDEHGIKDFTPQIVRDAVVSIRSAKLPDVAKVANNGSFFHNPVVPRDQLTQLLADYPNIIYWQAEGNNVKISGAWLIEQAGFKDIHDEETGMATWPNQPLVFVNEKATTTAQLLQFRQKVIEAVQQKFNITLQQEPELIA
jgi:UDP-N-acetylmuramate dehydrogenase